MKSYLTMHYVGGVSHGKKDGGARPQPPPPPRKPHTAEITTCGAEQEVPPPPCHFECGGGGGVGCQGPLLADSQPAANDRNTIKHQRARRLLLAAADRHPHFAGGCRKLFKLSLQLRKAATELSFFTVIPESFFFRPVQL